jgi:hypothetical protein
VGDGNAFGEKLFEGPVFPDKDFAAAAQGIVTRNRRGYAMEIEPGC